MTDIQNKQDMAQASKCREWAAHHVERAKRSPWSKTRHLNAAASWTLLAVRLDDMETLAHPKQNPARQR
jgi:hypothetical protein